MKFGIWIIGIDIGLLALMLVCFIGCTDANISQMRGFGSKFRVSVYSGGTVVKAYVSTGKVETEGNSDGWYFTDSATQGLVRVSGTVIIEEIK